MSGKNPITEGLIEAYERWKSHTERCHYCRDFDLQPIRTTTLDPCPVGRRLIQYLLQWLDKGLRG